jgi:Kef-type K+ transport system membrane component KefB
MAAGLILGPSFIGKFFPRPFHRLFDPAIGQTLTIFSQVGLVLLLFLIGMEFEFSHLRSYGRKAAGISLAEIIIPFGAGLQLAKSAFERLWPVFVFQVGDSHNVPIETKG